MKKKSAVKSYNKSLMVAGVLALLVAGTWFIKGLFVTPNIAVVGGTIGGPSCVSNIASFSMSGSCLADPATFQSIQTKCTDGRTLNEGDSNTCVNQVEAYKRAQAFCGSTCLATTEPRPSVTPTAVPTSTAIPKPTPTSVPVPSGIPGTPPPTADPSPLVSCETEVYRIPAKLNLSQINKDSLLTYKVDPNVVVVAPGEKIAFNIRLTNAKPYPLVGGILDLQAWTGVLNLPAEPFNIVSKSPICNLQGDGKTISCVQEQFELGVGQSAYPNMFFVADVIANGSNSMNIMYSGIHSRSPFSCAPISVKVSPPQTSPGEICAQEYGSCVTTTNTCATYTDSCVKAKLCASPFKSCTGGIVVSPTPRVTPTPTRSPIYRWDPRDYMNRFYQRYQCRISCSRENTANGWNYCAKRCQ